MSLPCAALTKFYYGNEMCVHIGSIFGSAEYEGGIVLKQRNKNGNDSSFCFPENLSEITATGTVIPSVAFRFRDTSYWLRKLTIGSNVKRIGMEIVGNCSGLSEIEIPSVVSYISQQAFSGSGLKRAVVNSGDLGMWAFAYCYSLESITIREGVTSIDHSAFSECTNLVSVIIPNSVTNINGAFSKCYSLKNVTIGDGVKSIGGNMFGGCSSLENVHIGKAVTNIMGLTFNYCTSLSSISIPSAVGKIEANAFRGCKALKQIIFQGDAPQVVSGSFSGVSSSCVAYVRYGSTGWGDGDSWQGLTLQYYGANILTGSAIEIDGVYSIVAIGNSGITESDIAITAPLGASVVSTKTGYIVEIADDGMSATVSLRKPELLIPAPQDAEDITGVLAVIDESEISAKPELVNGEEIGAIKVNTVPGLYYQAAWGDKIGNLSSGEKVQASTGILYLGVIKQTGTAGFYKITVSDR